MVDHSGLKGATGNVTIALPAGTQWYLYFKTTAGKGLVRLDNIKLLLSRVSKLSF